MRSPRHLSFLRHPGAALAQSAKDARGLNGFFLLLFIDLCLVAPDTIATHLLRIPHTPLTGLRGLLSIYVNFGVYYLILLFALALILYYGLRRGTAAVKLDAALSMVALAWLPRTLVLSASVVMAQTGFSGALSPHLKVYGPDLITALLRFVLAFGPSIALLLIAIRQYRAQMMVASQTQEEDQAPAAPKNLTTPAALWLVLLLLPAALLFQGLGSHSNLENIRPVVPGDHAPHFQVRDIHSGQSVGGEILHGKVSLIDFWATWCGPCVAAMPDLAELQQTYGNRGFRVVSINVEHDNIEHVRAFAAKHQLPFAVLSDRGEAQKHYRVDTFPTMVIVDSNGTVRYTHIGGTSKKTLEKEIQSLLH